MTRAVNRSSAAKVVTFPAAPRVPKAPAAFNKLSNRAIQRVDLYRDDYEGEWKPRWWALAAAMGLAMWLAIILGLCWLAGYM